MNKIVEQDLQNIVSAPLPNIDLLKALGWNPTIGIEEGFRRTVASYVK